MCCGSSQTLKLPAAVIEMLAHYHRLLDERGWDWGDDRMEMFRWARFSMLGPVFEAYSETGDWAGAVRRVVGDDVPAGVAVVDIDGDGGLRAAVGPARPGIAGRTVPIDVVVDSHADTDLLVTVGGRQVRVAAGGAAVETIDVDGGTGVFTVGTLRIGGAVRPAASAELVLTSPACARWSVTDASGGAWFPEGVLPKWDVHDRPFFHGRDVRLPVPAEELRVACARGLEFDRVELDVVPATGERRVVGCDPPRLFDPGAHGWYGGDLHVHMNYSGDLVCTPADAARMQLGEGLHLMSLLAANCLTSLVYDREMLEQFAGTDLPWSTETAVARAGVEFRNDLLGHVHALDPDRPPDRYYTGHERSDHPEDWPPNKVACEELRSYGATVGYAHPAYAEFPEDWSTDEFFRNPRSVEARELVADAALGLVDSVDLISPFNDEGALFLYYRLLSCGLRLAATAGTDTFLSFSHGPGTGSNPPGWGRVYAHLGEERLSVTAFKDAIRDGRTIVTNGPWLALDVDGHGPGAVLDRHPGDRLQLSVHVEGPGADYVAIMGPDGAVAEDDGESDLRFEVMVDGPTWLAAVARGGPDRRVLDRVPLAHTSPVYVDVAGERVARRADAAWCLQFLDRLADLVGEHGRFDPDPSTRASHRADVHAVLERARSFYRRVARSATR